MRSSCPRLPLSWVAGVFLLACSAPAQESSEYLVGTLTGHRDAVASVAISPDGGTLVSGSYDNTIKVWRLSDGALLRTLAGHTDGVPTVAISPDGTTLVSGSVDKTIKVWRLSDGRLVRTLPVARDAGHTGGVYSVAISPNGRRLASGSQDNTVKVWRLSDGALLRTLPVAGDAGHTDWVSSVAISPDGTTLVSGSGSYDKTIKVWRLSDGGLLRTLTGHTAWVSSVAISPDGGTLVSGSTDNTIKVWRLSDGGLLRTLTGHTGSVYSVAISPPPPSGAAGGTLVSGSEDMTIKVWRLSDGALLRTLTGHTGGVYSVAISPDGATLVSGSWDNTIRVWRLHLGPPPPPPMTGPPRLELAATFEEPSGNRALDAYEEATLALTVRNTGRGAAAGLRVAIRGEGIPGVAVVPPDDAVPALQVNGETTLRVRLRADGTAQDRAVCLRVVVEEARGFNSDTLVVEFETRAERPPRLEIARLGLNDVTGERTFGNGDGQFQPGESVEVIAFVENTGTGAAEAVTAEITSGHQHVYLLTPPNGIASLGDIPPGGSAELSLVLTVAPVYSGPPTLPIRVKLSDRRERYRWELPLGLALLARTPTIQTVRVEAASEAPATGRATPTVSGPGAAQRRPDTSFSVAVLPLECPGMSQREVLTLTERLRVSLHQTGVFQVMERGKMEEILQEQGFQHSGCTTTECAVEIGQLLAVRQMVAGSVGKVGETYSVSLRVFDVETGQTLATVTQDCAGCVVDRILQLTLPQASAALAGEVLRDVSPR